MPSVPNVVSAPALKRARRGGPKSHSGCPTCKIRRVKCDETRPFCNRCVSTGRKCEGFADDSVKHSTAITFAAPFTVSSFPSDIASSLNEYETQHLNVFRFIFVPGISGYANSPRWEKLLLQAVHEEPAVRHAAIAFSALQLPNCVGGLSRSCGESETFALQQYGKSVKALHELLSRRDRHSIEAALVCSIICICFEILEGSHLIARDHLENSLRVLSSIEVDEDLSQAFARLDVQASTYIGRRVPAVRLLASNDITTIASTDGAEKLLYQELSRVWTFFRGTAEDYRYRAAGSVPARVLAQAIDISRRLSQWLEAFETFLSTVNGKRRREEVRHMNLLRIQHYAATILMAGSLHPEEIIYDAFDDAFKNIVHLAEDLLGEHNKSPAVKSFSMELGVTYPLFITAAKCRIATVREAAISLLLAVPHREGIWSSQVFAKIAMKAREVEEDGLDPTFLETHRVPESRRIHSIETDVDQKARHSGFSFRSRPNGVDGEWYDQQGFVTW